MSGKHKYLSQKFSDYGTKSKWLKIINVIISWSIQAIVTGRGIWQRERIMGRKEMENIFRASRTAHNS